MKRSMIKTLVCLFIVVFISSNSYSQNILAVDRDGSNGSSGAYTDCWPFFMDALEDNGYLYDYYEVIDPDDDGPDINTMMNYNIVIWFTGESWREASTLSPNDEFNLSLYLAGGGKLFLSAQDYLYDRYPSYGNFVPGQFPYDMLGLRTVAQDIWIIGDPDSLTVNGFGLASGMTISFADIFTTEKDELYIDDITNHIAMNLFEVIYPSPPGYCAIQHEADYYKTVFTTASFAAIISDDDRSDLLAAILNYFGGILSTCDYFDALDSGDYVAQELDNWSTWSGAPGPEDAMVTNEQSYSFPHSFRAIDGTDLLHYLTGENITEGMHAYAHRMYIPEGKSAYYSLHKDIVPGTEWGFEVMFYGNGTAIVNAGAAGAATFNYEQDTWHKNEVVVELDEDWANYYFDGSLIVSWQWSLGTFGNPGATTLASTNYYGWSSAGNNAMAYYDNTCYNDNVAFLADIEVDPDSICVTEPPTKSTLLNAEPYLYDKSLLTEPDSFSIKNVGYQDLVVDSIITDDNWLLLTSIPSTPFTLIPGDIDMVLFEIDWDQIGFETMNGIIRIYSDDPNEPLVFLDITAIPIPPYIIVSPSSNFVGWEAGSFNATVEANIPWSVDEDCTWISSNPISGVNNDTIEIIYDENLTNSIRICSMIIQGDDAADTLVVTQDLAVNIDELSSEVDVIIYPNPASNEIKISVEKYKIDLVEICSLTGVKLMQTYSEDGLIDVSHLETGVYLISVKCKNKKSVTKLIVK